VNSGSLQPSCSSVAVLATLVPTRGLPPMPTPVPTLQLTQSAALLPSKTATPPPDTSAGTWALMRAPPPAAAQGARGHAAGDGVGSAGPAAAGVLGGGVRPRHGPHRPPWPRPLQAGGGAGAGVPHAGPCPPPFPAPPHTEPPPHTHTGSPLPSAATHSADQQGAAAPARMRALNASCSAGVVVCAIGGLEVVQPGVLMA
jgi:hypothetical protein